MPNFLLADFRIYNKKMKTLKKIVNKERTNWNFLLKEFWVICLVTCIILTFNICSKTEYTHIYEFVFMNQTDYTLEFKFTKRRVKYTYTFTDADFTDAKPCINNSSQLHINKLN